MKRPGRNVVARVLASAPFINVPRVFNLRDLSQPKTATTENPAAAVEAPLIRKGYIYRSGLLAFIKDERKTKIASELGIKTIFDL
ncbi:hypothetical protein VTO42DRAFT_982 [Malbranchea cinnamomea]